MIDTTQWIHYHNDPGTLRLFLLKEFGWMMPQDITTQYQLCDQIINLLLGDR